MPKQLRELYSERYDERDVRVRMEAIQASEQARKNEQDSEKHHEKEGTRSEISKVIADNRKLCECDISQNSSQFVLILEWQDQPWCIISATNYFRRDKAYPGELAMAKFSLRRGIIDTLHIVSLISEIRSSSN